MACCNLWGHKESDMTERLHFHFSLSRIGEGNGNPLQYSCLENPMDRGAWPATVHRVAKSWTRLSEFISLHISSVQFSSVAQSCPTLFDPMNCSTPSLPVHHKLPEFTQTQVHRVSHAIQPSILWRPLLLLTPIPPSIRVFSNESALRTRWPKYSLPN